MRPGRGRGGRGRSCPARRVAPVHECMNMDVGVDVYMFCVVCGKGGILFWGGCELGRLVLSSACACIIHSSINPIKK